jgi:hypothetical protein
VKQGWETWQPPLYYVVSAFFSENTNGVFPGDLFRRVQVLSCSLFVLTMMLAILAWRRMGHASSTGWLGLVLFGLLPGHLFLAARVNNDVMMPLWGVGVTAACVDYAQRGRSRTLVFMSMVLLAAMMTKTSSLALCAGAGLVVLWRDHVDGRAWKARFARMAVIAVPSALWLVLWFWRNQVQTGHFMYVNAALRAELKVANVAWKYASFDVRAFLSESSFSTFTGRIRESYPTALATSLLSGEFNLEYLGLALQTFIRLLFLPLLGMLLFGLIRKPAVLVRPAWTACMFLVVCHAAFMVSYNWSYSYACNEDARLWAPVFYPIAAVWSWGYEATLMRVAGRVRATLRMAPYAFLALLLVFYWQLVMY